MSLRLAVLARPDAAASALANAPLGWATAPAAQGRGERDEGACANAYHALASLLVMRG